LFSIIFPVLTTGGPDMTPFSRPQVMPSEVQCRALPTEKFRVLYHFLRHHPDFGVGGISPQIWQSIHRAIGKMMHQWRGALFLDCCDDFSRTHPPLMAASSRQG